MEDELSLKDNVSNTYKFESCCEEREGFEPSLFNSSLNKNH